MSKSITIWRVPDETSGSVILDELGNDILDEFSNPILDETATIRNVTEWGVSTRSTTDWNNESVEQTGYVYDSALITYDNLYTYDYTFPVTNQSNNKNNTTWNVS